MSYKIKVVFAEGVTAADIDEMVRSVGADPDGIPPGSLSHEETMENGRLVFIDEWESKEIFDEFFNMNVSLMEQVGMPIPTVEEL